MMSHIWKKYSFVILFIATSFFMCMYIINTDSNNLNKQIIVNVEEGDTLWSIAKPYAESFGVDTSSVVQWIERENQLNGLPIKDGDQLVIPAVFSKDREVEVALDRE